MVSDSPSTIRRRKGSQYLHAYSRVPGKGSRAGTCQDAAHQRAAGTGRGEKGSETHSGRLSRKQVPPLCSTTLEPSEPSPGSKPGGVA